MSPEQVKGRDADKRSDIWAFGVVLYEMLSGQPAFVGDRTSDIVAAVTSRDVNWNALPQWTPLAVPNVDRALSRSRGQAAPARYRRSAHRARRAGSCRHGDRSVGWRIQSPSAASAEYRASWWLGSRASW